MAKQKRDKKYSPRPVRFPNLINRQVRFASLYGVIDQLERGHVDAALVDGQEIPFYHDLSEGGHYELAPALEGWVVFMQMLAKEAGIAVDTKAHTRVATALSKGILLQREHVAAMREEVRHHEALFDRTTWQQRDRVARAAQIKIRLESLGEVA